MVAKVKATKEVQPHPGDRRDWLAGDDSVLQVGLFNDHPGWRVAIWGPDDIGMERDNMSHEEAQDLFTRIKDGVSMSDLRHWGFEAA